MTQIRILLAEDHALVRAGLRVLLERIKTVKVVGEAADGREALRLIPKHKPHIILLDIAMPGLNGLEAARRITTEHPDVRVIILSMHANEEYVWQAMKAGISGYLLKSAGTAELERAIKTVARAKRYFNNTISRRVVEKYIERIGAEGDVLDILTGRQREVLQLVVEGHTTKHIAQTLNISVKTVETHRTKLMERLGIHDIPGLVRFAIRTGLITEG